jgi:hypothetical protein
MKGVELYGQVRRAHLLRERERLAEVGLGQFCLPLFEQQFAAYPKRLGRNTGLSKSSRSACSIVSHASARKPARS